MRLRVCKDDVWLDVSSGDGAVISKRQTGLRIVVRAVLLVNSFRSLVVTIFSKNCHLLQTPNSDGLSRNTCCTLQTRLLISTTLNPVGYAVIFRTFLLTRLCRLSKQSLRYVASLAPSPFTDPAHAGPQFLAIPPTTTSEVAHLLASLPPKSSSVDYIPTSLLKSCTVFAELISKLANQSFAEGQFPGRFKLASVTPLLKKPGLDRGCVANYRPISNLNNISKTIEHLFLARFQPHILLSRNFNSMQSAYRPYHSTETALNRTLNDVHQSIDHGEPTLLVSLDLSAAFDTIDHSSLLSRLNTSFGVSDTALLAGFLPFRSLPGCSHRQRVFSYHEL
jgi:hypothetical protein